MYNSFRQVVEWIYYDERIKVMSDGSKLYSACIKRDSDEIIARHDHSSYNNTEDGMEICRKAILDNICILGIKKAIIEINQLNYGY